MRSACARRLRHDGRADTESDPIEGFNRGVYKFNDALDRGVLKPTAKAYVKWTPDWFRTGVGNFFMNLKGPGTIVNQLLQGKFREAGQDTARLLLNTTFGLGGVIDVASMNELPQHDEDLGQTLGKWGVPPGPYLMLPFLGTRHGAGRAVEDRRHFSRAALLVRHRQRTLGLAWP